MTLKKIQDDVDEWTSKFNPQYWKPHEILARLIEETGELALEINHLYGPKKKKSSDETKGLVGEIADIFFTLCCLANSTGIDLEESWQKMMEKIRNRDNNRFERI
jgi:NTP pyrophosphatase (non-canonical NTP hydrolase)